MTRPRWTGTAAVVLNWRTPDLTVRAVGALIDAGVPVGGIVVVDNGSDAAADALTARLPRCRVLVLSTNLGFAKANNLGAAERPDAAAYLFVNSDAFIRGGSDLAAMSADLDRPGVGVVVPRLLNEDLTLQPSVRPFPGPLVAALRATGLERVLPDSAQPSLGTRWSHRRSRHVHCATGAVMLVRGETWRELGGFDESAFMYAEDIDLCWRARRLGWLTWFSAQSRWVHLGNSSGTLAWSDPERWRRMGAAEAALVRRHLPPRSASVTLALLRAGLLSRELGWRALGSTPRAQAWRAQRHGFAHRP